MKEQKIYVEISGGCYQSATNVPEGWAIELIDWDNLLGDAADTAEEWNRLDVEAQEFIKENYPEDYKRVLRGLPSPSNG
jgi:hypothetical protein